MVIIAHVAIVVTRLSCSNYIFCCIQLIMKEADLLRIMYTFIVTLKFFEFFDSVKRKQKTTGT